MLLFVYKLTNLSELAKGGREMSNINIKPFYSKGYENTELIKVTMNEQGQQLVSGRELHEVLKVQGDFTHWVKKQLENVDALKMGISQRSSLKTSFRKQGKQHTITF